jgi:hypothetical protein
MGAAIYLTSFFLPAAATDETAPLPGFLCAIFAFQPMLVGKPDGLLAMAAGLLNPIILCYSAAWIARAPGNARPLLAAGSVVSVAAAAEYLLRTHMIIYSGFFAWSGSALLITCGDLLDAASRWVAAGEPDAARPGSGQSRSKFR